MTSAQDSSRASASAGALLSCSGSLAGCEQVERARHESPSFLTDQPLPLS
jgi:hypothetical protein